MVKLTDLIGLHKLQGFDTSIPNKKIDDCKEADEGICFILDDKKYQIYCDPSDGYRSYLTDLYTDEDIKCRNRFKDEEVFIVDASKLLEDHNLEGIVILSMTGKIIGKIITDHSDDWYPCARVEWYPENLMMNQKKMNKLTIFNTDVPLEQIEVKNSGINNVYYQIDINKSFGDKLGFCKNFVIREHYDESSNSVTLSFGLTDINCENFYSFIDFCDTYQDEINFGEIKWRD